MPAFGFYLNSISNFISLGSAQKLWSHFEFWSNILTQAYIHKFNSYDMFLMVLFLTYNGENETVDEEWSFPNSYNLISYYYRGYFSLLVWYDIIMSEIHFMII